MVISFVNRRRRSRRGQAATELALATLVFVTVLVFGLHFAEVGYLSLKVTEAANFATYDLTGRQMHQYSNRLNTNQRSASVDSSRAEAEERYADFDGRKTPGNPVARPALLFTTAQDIRVECRVINGPDGLFPDLDVGGGLGNIYQNADEGGAACRAETRLDLVNIGAFHDTGSRGYFKADHVASGQTSYKICSGNRAWGGGGNGNCDGEVPIVLGDWSFSDTENDEAKECDLFDRGGCDNPNYYDTVQTAFDVVKGPTGKGQQLAVQVAGYGTNEGAYWFAFKGEESQFRQDLQGVHAGDRVWSITPGGTGHAAVPEYRRAYDEREACFMGFPCDWKFSTRPN